MIEENARGNHRKKAPQRAQPGVLMTPLLLRRDRRRENMRKAEILEFQNIQDGISRYINSTMIFLAFGDVYNPPWLG